MYTISDSGRRMDLQTEERCFHKKRPVRTKKHGGRSIGRGAAQTGKCPPAKPNALNLPQDRREKLGRGDGRPQSKSPGMNDPYGINIATLNIFENQIVPMGYTDFQNHSDQIWSLFVCYLWAQSLFLNGGTPISNSRSRNLRIK